MPRLEPLAFLEAIAFWSDKIKISPLQFAALSDRARTIAFAVAAITKADQVNLIYSGIEKALAQGVTFSTFQRDLLAGGFSGDTRATLDTIFRTNVQTAYNAGVYSELSRSKVLFPYWQYSAINDDLTRPTHHAMDNRVFPADHPVWRVWFPPNGFN